MSYRKKSIGLLLLAFIFCPRLAYASGMEGFGYIILLFVFFVAAVPGAILKHLLPLPGKGSRMVFKVMLAEAILLTASSLIASMLVEASPNYPMFLPPATLIYSVCAILPNVFLLRENKHRFIEALLQPENIVYAILLGLPTAICFGLITIRFLYALPIIFTLLYLLFP